MTTGDNIFSGLKMIGGASFLAGPGRAGRRSPDISPVQIRAREKIAPRRAVSEQCREILASVGFTAFPPTIRKARP